MSQAKVSYTFGREPMSQYNETLAGVRDRTPKHQFLVDIPARGPDGKLHPEISSEPRGAAGAGDKRIQAYNFRVIATNNPFNRVPWPKPARYDAKRYEVLALLVQAMEKKLGRPQVFHELTLIAPIPNQKADFNNQGAFSTDYIGKNYDYPGAGYQRREEIWRDHVDYVQGFYYFLANDPRIPRSLQMEVREWGLPKDEYEDTGHWPHQLYVREARRMVSDYVMTQHDCEGRRRAQDAVGLAAYTMDSHNVRRYLDAEGRVRNEGDVQVGGFSPYPIAYRSIVPRRGECVNLLVPVCLSASHIAYGSIRMEPVFMVLAESAAVAAARAIEASCDVQDVAYEPLAAQLRAAGQKLEWANQ
jgi:hypothetical protein